MAAVRLYVPAAVSTGAAAVPPIEYWFRNKGDVIPKLGSGASFLNTFG